jgi:parallel beta-helix repeat protein
VSGVTVDGSTDDGIQFISTTKSKATDNRVLNSSDAGMSLYRETTCPACQASTGNQFSGNEIVGAGNHVIELEHGSNENKVVGNTLDGGLNVGIELLDEASNNQIQKNVIRRADAIGIHLMDDSDSNVIKGNQLVGSRTHGIFAEDGVDNLIMGNNVSGGGIDLEEGASSCVNTWKKNAFDTRNRDCID